MVRITLKRGKDKPIRMGHPWVFSGAVARYDGEAEAGEPCIVLDAGGGMLGYGYCNPRSSIAVRMLTRGDVPFDEALLCRRIEAALAERRDIAGDATNAYRCINSEGDFLPGLVVDRYAEGLCMQILTAGMERYRAAISSCLLKLLAPSFIYERSDGEQRMREGLEKRKMLLSGIMPEKLIVRENGLRFAADLAEGQKTGMFLDQRENRMLVRRYAAGRRMADCFAYAGGFSVNALAAGAISAVAVDSSQRGLALARENRRLNGFGARDEDFIESDVFSFLRESSAAYSLIVIDPPKFAKHDRDVHQACRGYKDINLLAMRRCAAGGVIFTFSCSQAVDAKLFRQVVFAAAADSGRAVQVLHVLSQPPDHPANAAHKEGEYLKGLVLRVAE